MRSVVFNGPGRPLTVETVAEPDPGEHEIVVRVGRCGICGSDVSLTDTRSLVHFPVGARLGHEYSGEVVAIGRSVEGIRIGDRVAAMPTAGCGTCPACLAGDPNGCAQCDHIMGGYAEYARSDARLAVKLPDALSLADGALAEPLACGGQAVRLAGIAPGSAVAVIGAGPIGLAAIHAARHGGAGKIIALAATDRARDMALECGADMFLTGEPSVESLTDALDGALPATVIECAGASGMIGTALNLVAPRGTVVAAGLCFDDQSIGFGAAIGKQATIRFTLAYALQDFRRAVDQLDAGHVAPRAMMGETIALADVPATIEALRTRRAGGKPMVDPWMDSPRETA